MTGRGIVVRATVSFLVVCMACVSGWPETHTYVFDPCQSTVLLRNWSWGYYEVWYYIEGEFQFSVDFNDVTGTAGFDWVDGNLTDEVGYCEDGMQSTDSLDVLFHMTDLNCIDGNAANIRFLYEKNNPTFPNADVNVIVAFVGDSIHISARFSEECYDGSQYDMNAVGVLKKYGGGLGDGNYPYLIYDANQMNAIGANPNDWDKDFKLMADIDLGAYTGTSYNMIGTYPLVGGTPFSGVFDGNGHTISDFTYTSDGPGVIGIFGYIGGASAAVRNLTLVEPNVVAGTGHYVGALVGILALGNINNCFVEGGSVSGDECIGGLAGLADSLSDTITNSGAKCTVLGNEIVGGLAGANNSNIRNSYYIGSVSGNGEVGGFVGRNIAGYMGAASINNCYARGFVSGDNIVGGLVGYNLQSALIRKCYSTGAVSGNSNVGGLIGSNDNFAPDSFWDEESSDCNSSAGGTGKTTAEMQMESTFTDAGWDFVGEVINGANDIWEICEGTNYPKFVWQIPAGDLACPDGVTLVDFSVLGAAWYSGPGDGNWDPNCDISEPNDNLIDERDLRVFAENYLSGI